jgi:hypothetical protein
MLYFAEGNLITLAFNTGSWQVQENQLNPFYKQEKEKLDIWCGIEHHNTQKCSNNPFKSNYLFLSSARQQNCCRTPTCRKTY